MHTHLEVSIFTHIQKGFTLTSVQHARTHSDSAAREDRHVDGLEPSAHRPHGQEGSKGWLISDDLVSQKLSERSPEGRPWLICRTLHRLVGKV